MRLAGYAALFNHTDASGDIILPGAFSRTLAERKERPPLLWQHRSEQRIGQVETIAEDKRGLRIIARIGSSASRGSTMLRHRLVNGLSFGFRVRRFEHRSGGRILQDVDLLEISLVTHPLQHRARVHYFA